MELFLKISAKSSILDASDCHRKIVSFLKKGWNECTKLCDSRAFVSYVPYVLYMPYMPRWFTCSRTLRVCVPSCLLTCLLFFTCSMCLHYFKCFHFIRAFIFLRALCAFILLHALRACNSSRSLRALFFLGALNDFMFYVLYMFSLFS